MWVKLQMFLDFDGIILKTITENFSFLKLAYKSVILGIFLASVTLRFLNDTSKAFIDKTDSANILKREDFWRKTMKNIAPYELNIEVSVYDQL